MKRKIFLRLMSIGLMSLLLSAIIFVIMFFVVFERRVDEEIRTAADMITAVYDQSGDLAELDAIAREGLRITLVAPDGRVLFESARSADGMENHLDREEIAEAFASGRGMARRTSGSVGGKTYYCAVLTGDGNALRVGMDSNAATRALRGSLPALAAAGVVIILLSVLLSNLLTRALVRPIVAMADDLEHIGDNVPYPELRPFADSVVETQKRNRENERIRQEFTANVSHELKTPLTSISGYAEMIENGMARHEDIQEFAGKIHNETGRLIGLIHDIIKLSELEEPEQALFEEVDLRGVADDAVRLLALNAENFGVTLSTEGERRVVTGSRSMLEELVYNLCDNGIRYNRPGGSVKVSVGSDERGRTQLTVSDTGIGIPPEHLGRIFERFYRADKSRSKATGGTGLGLAIVKHIAIRHGAEIKVSSTVGSGTVIKIVFPTE